MPKPIPSRPAAKALLDLGPLAAVSSRYDAAYGKRAPRVAYRHTLLPAGSKRG